MKCRFDRSFRRKRERDRGRGDASADEKRCASAVVGAVRRRSRRFDSTLDLNIERRRIGLAIAVGYPRKRTEVRDANCRLPITKI